MLKCSCLFVLCLSVAISASAQASPKPADTKPDYSKEAFVDEEDLTKLTFENDGTGTRETTFQVRIQSDAGVQHYSVLSFPYQEATETVEIVYVRVRKPDGTVTVTPAENVLDMPSDITRQAPFYSDLHEKHVAVKGLNVGDVLESQARWRVTKPLAPGQFWFAINFSHDMILLHQELQISVPRDRAVKWKSPAAKPVITEEGGHRIFTWTFSQLEHRSPDQDKAAQEEKAYQAARGKLPPPDIQLSSFQTWQDIGAWYGGLQQERVKPSPEIRAKAAELTKNATDNNAKLQAIYNYVSTQFRYIGVAFGIGRYQPHAAEDVLANQYGDCKDKHTLLASLLDAAGIKAYPALINTSRDFDPDVPSPAQFDHVITVVPQGKDFLWLDTTAEVAPFGQLFSVLLDKTALVVPLDRPPILVTTPAAGSSPSVETFNIEATLNDSGTLEGKIQRSVSGGDSEIVLRAAFRKLPQTQWRDLVQQLSYASGFSGEVSQVTASVPERLEGPFQFEYKYSRKDFPNWSDHRIGSPLPPILMPLPDTKPSQPVRWGSVQSFHYESHVTLPLGYTPQLPVRVSRKEDFAEYEAVYSTNDGALVTSRTLAAKVTEVPISQYEVFKNFAKLVADDQNEYVPLVSSKSLTRTNYQDEIWNLPYSEKPEAAQAYEAARQAFLRKSGTDAEISSLKHALEIDPKFTRAWLWLGEIYKFTGRQELAVQSYRKAIEADPNQLVSYKALGYTLSRMQKYEEAVSAWQDLLKLAPQNVNGLTGMAAALSSLKRYGEAASALKSAVLALPGNPDVQVMLGTCLLKAGEEDHALVAFKKAIELDDTPLSYNDIAYEMADENKQLPLALEYAEKAVGQEEEVSAKIKLSDLKMKDLDTNSSLAAYWDTLGWAHFRLGNLAQAEKYLNAGWELGRAPVQADHLGQVYEQQQKKDQAVRMYKLALAASFRPEGLKDTQGRLDRLTDTTKTKRSGENGGAELSATRTFKMETITKKASTAEYFVLIGPGSKVEETKFISGSDELNSADKALRAIQFKFPFPDDGRSHLVRRGILGCYPATGCSFVLYNLSDVHSVD